MKIKYKLISKTKIMQTERIPSSTDPLNPLNIIIIASFITVAAALDGRIPINQSGII